MAKREERLVVAGSYRPPASAEEIRKPDPNERVTVTIVVPSRAGDDELAAHPAATGLPEQRRYLGRKAFEEQYGADPASIEAVTRFADQYGLRVDEASVPKRLVVVSGTLKDVMAAFHPEDLSVRVHPEHGEFRARSGTLSVPAWVAPHVEAVLGIDNRPQARPRFRRRDSAGLKSHATDHAFNPLELAEAYEFPAATGEGQCIGIIELGGGFRKEDLDVYFGGLGIGTPEVIADETLAPNAPGDDSDAEVVLDILFSGGGAPKARIVVYFAPNTDAGFRRAIANAVHDETNRPSVISISWGSAESGWTGQAIQDFDRVFREAALLGVTVCAASGDSGSDDGVGDHLAHADYPASSAGVLGCGGTRLQVAGGKIVGEVVWNDGPGFVSGGGISDREALPEWQANAGIPPSANPGHAIGRGVPDVSGQAAAFAVRVDGQNTVVAGTSGVAPLWAGLIALMNQLLPKPVGFLNPLIYPQLGGGALRDITSGTNGAYRAGAGWDACTGLGSPNGQRLLQLLSGASGSGGAQAGSGPSAAGAMLRHGAAAGGAAGEWRSLVEVLVHLTRLHASGMAPADSHNGNGERSAEPAALEPPVGRAR